MVVRDKKDAFAAMTRRHSEYHMTLRNLILHQLALPGGGGRSGMPPLLLVFPVPKDVRSDVPPDLLLFPGIEMEKV